MVEICEYEALYDSQIVSLLIELQGFLVDIDPLGVQQLNDAYKSEYFEYVKESVRNAGGKIYVAISDGRVVGAVAGVIEQKDREDELTNTCPKRGKVTELIVSNKQ